MPTADSPRGANLQLFTKKQSAFKTAATGNYAPTLAYSFRGGEATPFVDDDTLGQVLQNSVDAVAPGPGLSDSKMTAVVPLDLNHLGFWLDLIFGAPASSGADPDYVHAYTSALAVLPERTLERQLNKASGTINLREIGVVADKVTLQASRAAGYARLSLDLMGYGTNNLAGTSGAGTPAAILARDALAATLGVYKVDGTIASLLQCNLTFANNLVPRNEMGDARVGGFDLGPRKTLTGSIQLRLRDTTLYDAAIASTAHAGELLFQRTSARLLSWAMPQVKLERPTIDADGPGGMDVTFNLRAEQTAAAPMLTCTLKSGTAAAAWV